MASYTSLRAAHKGTGLPVPEKEPLPLKKAKRTISVSTLFGQQQELKRKAKRGHRDVLAPKAVGIVKQYASPCTRGTEDNIILRKFLGTSKAYRDRSCVGTQEQLDTVYEELIAQVDSLSVGGDAVDAKTQAQISDLAVQYAQLVSPLGDDKMQIQHQITDGATVNEERKLSDTMTKFERVLDQKRGELTQLLRQLEEVDGEIAAVKQDIVVTEQKGVKKAQRDFEAKVASLKKQAEASKGATLAEVEKARKNEKKATEAQAKAFEEFMENFF